MAYQSVGTSRFYVNVLEWLAATGYLSSINNIHRTLPVTPMPYSYSAYGIPNMLTDKSFVAILGHNLETKSFSIVELINDNLACIIGGGKASGSQLVAS